MSRIAHASLRLPGVSSRARWVVVPAGEKSCHGTCNSLPCGFSKRSRASSAGPPPVIRGANKARVGDTRGKMSKRARDEDASLPQQPRRKRLGASDIEVCEVCLGTMTFGSMTADEATCHQILDRYVALGGNFIDTARAAPNPDAEPKPKPKARTKP